MQRVNESSNGVGVTSAPNVKYVRLYKYSGADYIDITSVINYIEIFESIYDTFVTVNINITDTLSMHSTLRLTGEEFVEVDICDPTGSVGYIKQAFSIYMLADRITNANASVIYTLKCISPSAIVDMNLKISKAYSGQPADLVLTEFGKTLSILDKPVVCEPTKNVVQYISNYWSPLQNIKYLCDRSVSSTSSAPSYLFFERSKDFRFQSLNFMVSQQPVDHFMYSINSQSADVRNNPANQMPIMYNLHIDSGFNYIDRLMTGAYGNRTLTVDPLTKSYSYDYYDFTESFSKFSRLNQLPFASVDAPRRLNSVFRTRVAPSKTFTSMVSENSIDWYKQRLTELAAINSSTIEFNAAGRFNVNAGDVISVAIPKLNAKSPISNDTVELSKLLDKMLSGRYLITSLRHLIDRERHSVFIQASKDSVFKEAS